jgi:hypothetical protein
MEVELRKVSENGVELKKMFMEVEWRKIIETDSLF